MGRIAGVVSFLLVIGLFQAASGETWYVDHSVFASGSGTSWEAASKTIQEGIDAASRGDSVVVAVGTIR